MLDYSSEFSGSRVVVTGAAGIFGTWIAEAFAAAGAELFLTDARADEVEAVANRLGARWIAADLTDANDLTRLADAFCDAWESPDILVNNAGIYPRTPLATTDPLLVRRILDINVVAPYELSRRAVGAMSKAGVAGSIVNVSSGAAIRPGVAGSIYAASKAALETMTRSLALEVAPQGIRVNCVQPGFAPGSDVSALSSDHIEKMLARIPLGRSSGRDDAASAVLWLCSSAASFVTGTTVAVDGGRTAGDYTAPAAVEASA
jgi:3-oxoacyl-[acyl-carrier protein] reductase